MFIRLIQLEILALTRDSYSILLPIVFLLVFTLLFPLSITTDPSLLSKIAAGICWLGALLSQIITIDKVFRDEYEQGVLEQWLASGISVIQFVQARIICYWVAISLPVAATSAVVAFMLSLPIDMFLHLILGLLTGSLSLVSIGCFIASLTISSKRSSMLVILLIIPLMVPIVIIGVSAVTLGIEQTSNFSLIILLAGLALINLVVAPLLTMISLRLMLS